MKIHPLTDEQGRTLAFEVDNLMCSRRRVRKIVAGIEGAELEAAVAWYKTDPDRFCVFSVDGGKFAVEEPFGDNSRFWIGPEPPVFHSSISKVIPAFEKASLVG